MRVARQWKSWHWQAFSCVMFMVVEAQLLVRNYGGVAIEAFPRALPHLAVPYYEV